jgi:hypothetical protein
VVDLLAKTCSNRLVDALDCTAQVSENPKLPSGTGSEI